MYSQIIIITISLIKVCRFCIPTQQVDSNSRTNPNGGGGTNGGGALTTAATTTTVATTTVTEPPFPCNNCPKIYDTTCQGFGIPNWYQWCPTAAEVGIEYTLGLITTLFPFIPLGSCGTVITCPLTTALRIKLFNREIPAPVFYAWCEESGSGAGIWYTGTSLLPLELVSLACKPIL